MSKNILIVDDEPNTVRLLRLALEQANYRVTTAENGQQALECAAKDRPDLIVMDTVMPVMSGLDALQQLKSNVATADIPVVMLTAQDSSEEMSRGWKSGTDLYLTKPFFPAEVLSYIECILS